ncbi:MAG: hypothetical protein IBX43_02110 [Campylobacterales bacterium]|nr:hypothetical protein [Campylobacterales bacterium]
MTRINIAAWVLGTLLMAAPMAMAAEAGAKCGAGKCGGSKDAKTKEQGKCGSSKEKAADAKCGGDKEKKADAKCGTGKCGGSK